MKINNLIGDYQAFFSDLLQRMDEVGINVANRPMSHLTYRTSTLEEYEILRDNLIPLCGEYVETQFNGRAVAIAILKEPLKLERGFMVDLIEVTAPRSVHMYPSGLESFGVVLEDLPTFIEKHNDILTGIKDHGVHCQPAFLTFENDKTAKFYDFSLREIVLLQGWKIEKIDQSIRNF